MPRKGDNAPMALIEMIMEETVTSSANRTTRRAARVGQSTGSDPRAAAAVPSAPVEAGEATDSTDALVEQPAPIAAGETTEGTDLVADNDTPATTVAGDADRVRSDFTQAEQAASEAPAEGDPSGTDNLAEDDQASK